MIESPRFLGQISKTLRPRPCSTPTFSAASNIRHSDTSAIHTADLRKRLQKHNAGEVPHTVKFKPWKVEAYFAFETEDKAVAFEVYLKTGSGHAFAKRHF